MFIQQNMTNMIMNEIIQNDNANVLHKQRSSSTNMYTSDFESPAIRTVIRKSIHRGQR